MTPTIETAIKHWAHIAPVLSPPRSAAAHRRMVAALDAVLDAGGGDAAHPLASLADYMGEMIRTYEDAHHPRAEMSVGAFLRELLKREGLRQSEVPEIGTQGMVSDVLRGKRKLTARQIAALSRRFSIPADALLN